MAMSDVAVRTLAGGCGAPGSTAKAPHSWVDRQLNPHRGIHSLSIAQTVT